MILRRHDKFQSGYSSGFSVGISLRYIVLNYDFSAINRPIDATTRDPFQDPNRYRIPQAQVLIQLSSKEEWKIVYFVSQKQYTVAFW